ncbi:MAG: peptide chain release factor 2 [Candidatus Eisenbacteria bacterium]|nr:peptide chain release factor 2 [Candidatus Eisenbacteria bacterium]
MILELERTYADGGTRLTSLRGYLDVDHREQLVREFEEKLAAPGFWDRPQQAREVLRNLRREKAVLNRWRQVHQVWEDLGVLISLADEEPTAEAEAASTAKKFAKELEDFELTTLLDGEYDANNAILAIHPGAGGTESQDWAEMLYRMYLRYLEQAGFKATILDYQAGDEAGVKDATIEIEGDYAYGYLKAEGGVHRLVRISPFDAQKRRHTSFASVQVLPQVEELADVEIKDEDLRVDTFRSSGAGGQHVNKTESAVRLTHLPTGIVVSSQAERSQHRNRDFAMKILSAKLWAYYRDQEEKKLGHLTNNKMEIAFGSQIRSYVFQPYQMVKDHRTNHEIGDIQRVMDGDLDPFIQAYLRLPRK